MKKFILAIVAIVLSAATLSAQDMAQATELYNNGATALQTGDKAGALDYFQQALSMGKEIGEEADELVTNCKNAIPGVALSIAKDYIKDSKYDEALAQIEVARGFAAEFENEEIIAEIKEVIPALWAKKGGEALKEKNLEVAAEALTNAFAADTTNAKNALTLGQVLSAQGKIDEAIEAFQHAAWNGQEQAAKTQMSGTYLKVASAALKAGKMADAIKAANTANSFAENANAYLIAGQASQKLNKASDAVENFTKYLELKPDAANASAITYTVAALYQTALKNNGKALEYYNKIKDDAKFGAQAKAQIAALGGK